MSILAKLAFRSVMKNKVRSLVTVVGITISSLLISTVAVAASSFYSTRVEDAIYKNGDWHKEVHYQDMATYDRVAKAQCIDNVKYTYYVGVTGSFHGVTLDEYKKDCVEGEQRTRVCTVKAVSWDMEQNEFSIHLAEGKYPKTPDEILLPDSFKEYMGGIKVGDVVSVDLWDAYFNDMTINEYAMKYPEHADQVLHPFHYENNDFHPDVKEKETRSYTVCGFFQSFDNYYLNGAMNESPYYNCYDTAFVMADEEQAKTAPLDIYLTYTSVYYLQYGNDPMDTGGELQFISSGKTTHSALNSRLMDAFGIDIGGQLMINELILFGIFAFIMLLVVVGAVSMIYNSFAISVSERSRQFGLLSSVGATKVQMRTSVVMEALIIGVVGTVLGIALSLGLAAMVVEKLRPLMTMMFTIPFTLRVSPIAIIIAVAVSMLTVLISALIPSKKALSVTAIEAIRQNSSINDKVIKTPKFISKLFGLSGMLAHKYYKRNKKRYRTTVVGLTLSITLFIGSAFFLDMMYDYIETAYGANGYNMLLSVYPLTTVDGKRAVQTEKAEKLLEQVRGFDEVEKAACTYYDQSDYRFEDFAMTDKNLLTDWGLNYRSNDYVWGSNHIETDIRYVPLDLCFVDDEAFRTLLKENHFDENEFMNGESPLAILLDQNVTYFAGEESYINAKIFKTIPESLTFFTLAQDPYEIFGDYFTITADADGQLYVSATNQETTVPNGSATWGEDENDSSAEKIKGDEVTVKIGGTISEAPYFLHYGGPSIVLLPQSAKEKLYSGWSSDTADTCNIFLFSNDHSVTAKAAEGFSDSEISVSVNDDAEDEERSINVMNAVQTVLIVAIALISLISVANVFNTISTNVLLRRREFAMLRSVGMTSSGFNGMMMFECLLYGVKAILFGLPVSFGIMLIAHLIMQNMLETSFNIPWLSIGAAVLGVFMVLFISMFYAMSRVKRANPIDELKNETT